jgi:hypothetical protein
MEEKKKEGNSTKELFQLNELFGYFFRKKDKSRKADFSLRSMHFVNKLSMAIFLIAILYLIIKNLI